MSSAAGLNFRKSELHSFSCFRKCRHLFHAVSSVTDRWIPTSVGWGYSLPAFPLHQTRHSFLSLLCSLLSVLLLLLLLLLTLPACLSYSSFFFFLFINSFYKLLIFFVAFFFFLEKLVFLLFAILHKSIQFVALSEHLFQKWPNNFWFKKSRFQWSFFFFITCCSNMCF